MPDFTRLSKVCWGTNISWISLIASIVILTFGILEVMRFQSASEVPGGVSRKGSPSLSQFAEHHCFLVNEFWKL